MKIFKSIWSFLAPRMLKWSNLGSSILGANDDYTCASHRRISRQFARRVNGVPPWRRRMSSSVFGVLEGSHLS